MNTEKALKWLANSPLATALQYAIVAALSWVVANINDLGIPPVLAVAILAAIPTLIGWLNPQDKRNGVGSQPE